MYRRFHNSWQFSSKMKNIYWNNLQGRNSKHNFFLSFVFSNLFLFKHWFTSIYWMMSVLVFINSTTRGILSSQLFVTIYTLSIFPLHTNSWDDTSWTLFVNSPVPGVWLRACRETTGTSRPRSRTSTGTGPPGTTR